MEKFQNKYRIQSARLQKWDYGWAGAYFITICTKNREHYFGKITNCKMHLSGAGILGDVFWHEIKNHAKNVELGAFMVMPNHIHGILILNGEYGNNMGFDNDIGNVQYHQYVQYHQRYHRNKPKKPLANNVFRILVKIPFRQLLVHTNRPLQNMPTVWDLH